MKICSYCELEKPKSEFTVRNASPDKLSYKCRSCRKTGPHGFNNDLGLMA